MVAASGKLDAFRPSETPISFEHIEGELIGMIARELVEGGHVKNGDRVALENKVGEWFTDVGDLSFAALFREVCCDGDVLKRGIAEECGGFHDPKERVEVILRRAGYVSFQQFFHMEGEELIDYLSLNGVEEIQKPVHDGIADATAAE